MFNKRLEDKISEIGFVYKDTNESHNSIVDSYYYYPSYTKAYYRFTITTNKRLEKFNGSVYEKKGIYLVYFANEDFNESSNSVIRLLDKHYYVNTDWILTWVKSISGSTLNKVYNFDDIDLFLNETFPIEYRDIKLKKLLCYI